MVYDEVARATVDIGGVDPQGDWISMGSGFHYCDNSHVITNFHVIKQLRENGITIRVRTENDNRSKAIIADHSDLEREGGDDWARLNLNSPLEGERVILSAGDTSVTRGDEVVFAGFPHGVGYGDTPDLLVQSARIAGEYGERGFHLDGSVNKGNSGGPIIHLDSESLIGYTTFKRYVEQKQIGEVMEAWDHLHRQVKNADEVFTTGDLGYFDVLTEMTRSFLLLRETIETNANTGIGIGFDVELLPTLQQA